MVVVTEFSSSPLVNEGEMRGESPSSSAANRTLGREGVGIVLLRMLSGVDNRTSNKRS